MLFLGIIWGAFHGRLAQVTEGALSAAGEAVTLSLTMVGIVAFWAATPAGLKAMKELEKIEEMRRKEKSTVRAVPKGTASNEMCTFLVMNISSLQLIPVNIIAYRSQYHSVSAAAVTGPCLVATMVSTLAAVFFCRIMDRSNKKGDVL